MESFFDFDRSDYLKYVKQPFVVNSKNMGYKDYYLYTTKNL